MEDNKLYGYNEKVKEIYQRLETSESGLTTEEANQRLLKYGENKLIERKKKSNFRLLIEQFNDFMIILLIFASIFSAIISFIRKKPM